MLVAMPRVAAGEATSARSTAWPSGTPMKPIAMTATLAGPPGPRPAGPGWRRSGDEQEREA